MKLISIACVLFGAAIIFLRLDWLSLRMQEPNEYCPSGTLCAQISERIAKVANLKGIEASVIVCHEIFV
jgi:hypothetical protein